MTVSSEYNEKTYLCNGTTTTFTIPWKFYSEEIMVYKNKTYSYYTKGTDYTVVNTDTGGEVVFNQAPPNGDYITIARAVPLYQYVQFLEGEDFPASDYEYSLDRIYMALQELKEELKRAWLVAPGNEAPEEMLSKYMVFRPPLGWITGEMAQKNEIAYAGGGLYIALNETTNPPSESSDDWSLIAKGGLYDVYTPGTDLKTEGTYSFYPMERSGHLDGNNTSFRVYGINNPPTIDAATGKVTIPGGITGVSKTYTQTNRSIPTTLWNEDTDIEGYGFAAAINFEESTTDMIPIVTFSAEAATSGNYAPVASAQNGSVKIYAKQIPSAAITVESIILQEA